MIAVDTSSWIAYLSGEHAPDVEATDRALVAEQVVLPPVVLTELLSDPDLSPTARTLFGQVPLLELTDGYWERAGTLRSKILARHRRARLADALIAQSCLDHEVGLITRDTDFRNFASYGLRILNPL